MGTGRVHIRITHPVDEVWAVIGDFTGIDSWFPGVESVEATEQGRKVGLPGGAEVSERLVTNDADLHRQQYALVDVPGVTSHLATIDVIDDREGSLVVYSFDVEPQAMVPFMQQNYVAALAALKEHVDTHAF